MAKSFEGNSGDTRLVRNSTTGEICTSRVSPIRTRVLCLGNDLLADDGVGLLAAQELRKMLPPEVEVVESCEAGFHLMDYLLDIDRVIVVDSIQTGKAAPGTVYHVTEDCLPKYQGSSPHYVGLFESLQLGNALGLDVAKDLQIVAVETADCVSLGGSMTPAVRAAVTEVGSLVGRVVG